MTRENNFQLYGCLVFLLIVELLLLPREGIIVDAKMEARFEKCCGLGTSWAMENLRCEKFTGPVNGVPRIEQGLCLETVDICCVRTYHDRQCEKGKADARNGLACVTSSSVKTPRRGDYHRDCCEGCKLGILTGSMGQGCSFKTFSFGIPWDPAFLQCCYEALPNTTLATDASDSTFSSDSSTETESVMSPDSSSSMTSLSSESSPSSSSFPSSPFSTDSTTIPTPPLDDICQLMKGLLCTDICIPTPGSYYCACREGFTLLEDGKTCRQDLPIDRCKSTNPCEQRCTDTGVAVRCSCNPGFELADDKRSCIPKSTTNSTESNDTDENNELLPLCPAGYRYDSTSQVCNDVNECLERKIQCPGLCENTIGSFRCIMDAQKSATYESCPPGYQWDARTKVCTDIDECVVLPNVCTEGTHFCVNTQGSYSCLEMVGTKSCPAGFKFDKISQICKDVDECAEGIHSCLETEECKNVAGAYECDMKCHKGFVYSISFGSCIDLNECTESTMPCPEPGTQCINTIGGYECKRSKDSISFDSSLNKIAKSFECPFGFKSSKNLTESCVDIDECTEQLHICESDERCLNIIGSYRCELLVYTDENVNDDQEQQEQQMRETGTILYSRGYKTGMQTTMPAIVNVNSLSCNSGYKFDEQTRQCVDVDECVSGTTVCSVGERCVNSMGTYECYAACLPGFKPYGEPGFNGKEDCRDIDECSLGLHTCKNTQVCRNTNGSYICQTLTTTTSTTTIKTSIADWTTLRTTTNSRANRKQINDRQWNVESCGLGYRRDYETGQCIDIDECVTGPGCRDHEKCRNTIGGYECSPLCSTGWYFSTTTKSCEDVDECLLGRHDCPQMTHQCVNTNGSYHCQLIPPCQNGFKRGFINGTCVDIDECSENLHDCRLQYHQYCVNKEGSYECLTRLPSCSSGYKYSLQSNTCEDMDECLSGEHTCDGRLSLRCINLPGTYRCEGLTIPEQRPTQRPACPSGFRYHPRLKKCTDIDECSEGLDSCGEEICYNQPGGYSCAKAPVPITRSPPTTPMTPSTNQKCLRGTKFVKNRGCVDIDECREIEDACSSNEECVNTMGSYTCNCRTGFRRDNLTQACVDINECQLKEDSCLPTQRCDNTIGSYICTRFLPCGTGYTLNAATEICEDNDECILGTHDCTAGYHCRNTFGSYRCDRNLRVTTPQAHPRVATTISTTTTTTMIPFTVAPNVQRVNCPQGFEISGDKCIDIDECQIIQNPCGRTTQRCVNTIGSYKCISRVICGNGFTLDSTTGQHCVDIDECADNSHECSPEQICENRQGGYICKCPPGHTDGPNKDCVDIDECSIYGSGICGMNSRCENTVGSYRCSCDTGFENIGNVAGGMCQDVDECQRTPGLCQHYCKNVWGSYRCGCKPGFKLNADNRSCTDIDECEEFKENNLCIGICENTPGSYTCKCPDGYKLGSDGRTCQDIDECSTGQSCRDPNDTCQNIRGGFKCNRIDCPSGYVKDHERRNRCVRASRYCKHNDYACFRMPSYYSFNYITFVSMFPIPESGNIELFTMRGTYQPGSNVQFTMAFVDVRAPPGITRATESCFALKRPLINQSVLVMTQSIQGPQEIELDLSMEIYHNSIFVGSAVAKLFIYVSQYEY